MHANIFLLLLRMNVLCTRFVGTLLWVLLPWSLSLPAQSPVNPFDLTIESPVEAAKPLESSNPFELLASAPRPLAPSLLPRNNQELKEVLHFQNKPASGFSETAVYRMKVFISLLLILFLGSLVSVFKATLKSLYEAFVNENMLSLLLRNQTKGIQRSYWFFYLLFFLSAGFAVYLISDRLKLHLPLSPLAQWLLYSFAVFGIFTVKHLLLSLIGLVYPLSKPLVIYSFTIMVFNCMLGLYLVPVDVFLALGPKALQNLAFAILLGGVGLFYLYRILRTFFIALPYAMNYPMHFLLYLCAVEIAPLLILWRFITSWQGQ